MPEITHEYIDSLPDIYRDILKVFPMFNPRQRLGTGVAFQSLYSALYDKHTLAEIRVACERMEDAGVLEIKDEIFANATTLGEQMIAKLTEGQLAEDTVPEFPPPNQ